MRTFVLLVAIQLAAASLAFTESTGFVPDVTLDKLVDLEAQFVPGTARPGEHVRVVTTAEVQPGWHIYSVQPQGEFGPLPTRVATDAAGLTLTGPVYETNPTHEADPAFGLDLWFHKGAARFYQNLTVPPGTATATVTVRQAVKYQVCNDRFCTPARTATLSPALTVEQGPVRPEYADMLRTVDYLDSSGRFRVQPDSLEGALAQGLPGFLLLAAGFGLLALLTPCVFPMIPVTVTFFTGQAKSGAGGVGLAVLFGLGLVASYTGLGLGMTFLLGSSGVERFAVSPWVNLAVAGFFVVFALALVGWIAPALPAGLVQGLDRSAARIHGPVGVLLMGVAFTAANFTCTLPFVGTLLLAASAGKVLWPLVGMLAFSTVFALPFVALALFPRWVLALRGRGGPWLTRLKVVLGLIEFGAALKFVSNADVVWGWGVFNREVLLALWGLIAAACGLLLLLGPAWTEARSQGRLPTRAWRAVLRSPLEAAWGVAFLALAVYLAVGVTGGELDAYTEAYLPPRVGAAAQTASTAPRGEDRAGGAVAALPWHPSLDQALALSKESGKPIFIDFTGYTCVNCRWMEKKVFAKPEVLAALRDRFVLVQLFTDGGPDGDSNQRLEVDRFRTLALPYYAILAPDNAVLATHAGILPSVPGFLEFLGQGARVALPNTASEPSASKRS